MTQAGGASGIFAATAPAYWAAGLPAIPLWPGQKRPIPEGWQAYAEEAVPEGTQALWLERHPSANIGLVLGPASGLCMVDVDTEDMALQGLLAKLLPLRVADVDLRVEIASHQAP